MNTNNKGRFVNVGTIGHVDHGKSTLTAAILSTLSRSYGQNKDDYHLAANKKHHRVQSGVPHSERLNHLYREQKSRFHHYKKQRRQ